MSAGIYLAAVLFFPGAYLLAKAFIQAREASLAPKVMRSYERVHADWSRTLIASGFLAFPGIALIKPVKCWFCAESAAISILFAGVIMTPPSRAWGWVLFTGCAVGISTLYLSLKSECAGAVSTFRQDLPLAAFMMSLLMESGLGPASAMKETIASLPGRGCAFELGEIMKGRELGITKSDLFDASRKRVPVDDYRSFLNLVEQGDKLGVGLSRGLRELSDRILESQSHRSEMLAQQAAVKMLLPLVLFIFPAVFLIVLSPVILNLCSMAGWK